ncbi:DUF1481 domain-containing protein [Vibrio sp. SCSIO 43135]|uniref:DUF1481 domain-containing protein n=1 Tax=Vibrio paucivorans TaxID=2829489 RepID=A0A9X3HR26_9VIBR|nr:MULTISPECIES: DUF1481 domain-containing protein [Vibrio]MCW8333820.1 DUF1481 domain-containing protein [Vibrio paucivorans]USD40976.1 DUF1481 domain-containing protein [Vibrio sp. SCSIO 43135]
MNKVFLSSLITSLLLGCSSTVPSPNLDQFSHYTGGQSMGDATSFYWYTERLTQPSSAADYVSSGDYGWYKTDYRWDDGTVREMIREGEQLKQNTKLVPYRVHVRFNKEGEAVYQQYRVDGKVLPLTQEQLLRYQQEADSIATVTKEQDSEGMELIQGYWDGSKFETCNGQVYDKIEFNQTLPSFVVNRLAAIDSYVAFLGKTRLSKVTVEELLMLADEDHECIAKPDMLSE